MKTILRIVKTILLIVELETGYAERSRIFVQASAIELAHIAERSRKSQSKNLKEKQDKLRIKI